MNQNLQKTDKLDNNGCCHGNDLFPNEDIIVISQTKEKKPKDADFNNGFYVLSDICGVECKLLIDTGATCSLLSKNVFFQIPKAIRPLLKDTNRRLMATNGQEIHSIGWVDLDIHLGDHILPVNFVVADIQDPGILGLSDLRKDKFTIQLNETRLYLGETEIPLHKSGETVHSHRVMIQRTITIPAATEVLVPGKLSSKGQNSSTTDLDLLIGPIDRLTEKYGILTARTLIRQNQQQIIIRMLNLNNEDVTLTAGQTVGTASPIMGIEEFDKPQHWIEVGTDKIRSSEHQEHSNPGQERPLPKHVQPLMDNLSPGLGKETIDYLKEKLTEYSDVFSKDETDLGKTHIVKHEIETGDARPIKQRARRLPFAQEEELTKLVEDLVTRKLVEPSSASWSSPVVMVRKKNGSYRLCVDYRRLNDVTIKDAYPLPIIDTTLRSLSGSAWFSTLDLSSGFWQVPLSKEASDKSTFVTKRGLWKFNVLPMGMSNSPGTFQRMMDLFLQGLSPEACYVYLDDIIALGTTAKENIDNLCKIFSRLRQANLKLSPEKCKLLKTSINFLGHNVSAQGISTDPNKVSAVAEWPIPRNAKEIQSFIGLISYYRKFINGFAEVSRCLTALTRKGVEFHWTNKTQAAFDEGKVR